MVEKEKTIFDYMLLSSVDINPLSEFLDNPEIDLSVKDKVGYTPLFYAIISGSKDQLLTQMILEHIIKYNKNIYDYLDINGSDIIDVLVLRGNIPVLETFLKFGLNANYKVDKNGNTFLHKVLLLGVVNIKSLLSYVYLFNKYNGDFTVKNNNGESCISLFLKKFNSQSNYSNRINYENRFIFESELDDFKAIIKFFSRHIELNRYLIPAKALLNLRKVLPDVFSDIQNRKNLDLVTINNILDELED